jgi:thiosulfate dehydrogenase [quinone] large subunit
VAVLISLSEVAVGLGTLLGLYGRVAALGGMLLALSFFLTVSFNDNPYYYGPDIVFLFAWTPFVLGGSGPWSLDAAFAARVTRARQAGAAAGRSPARRRQAAEIERRAFMQKASAAGVVGVTALVLGGVVAAVGRIVHGSQPAGSSQAIGGGATAQSSTTTTSVTTTTTVPPRGGATTSPPTTTTPVAVPRGTRIGPASDVPVGGAASFTDPAGGEPALVVQRTRGSFKAFSAVCPHAGCQVQFDQQNDLFVCPCHGSTFNAGTGAVLNGPAVTGLSPIAIALGPNNQLYVDG